MSSRLHPQDVVDRVSELPALPAIVMELLTSLGASDVDTESLARRISLDQALASKTLRLANSSFYGMSRQVTSIAEATSILGLRTLRNVAIAASVAGSFQPSCCPGLDLKAFWQHSIATALCARAMAEVLHLDEDSAFTLGLLHDVGRLALASGFPTEHAEMLRHRKVNDCLPLEAERVVLGTDHAVVGGLIAEHWRFAPRLVAAIAGHHDPQPIAGVGMAGSSLTDLVHIADNVAHALDLSHAADDLVPPLSIDAWSRLALEESLCLKVFRRAEVEHDALCQALMG